MKMEITTERGTYILAGTPEEMAAFIALDIEIHGQHEQTEPLPMQAEETKSEAPKKSRPKSPNRAGQKEVDWAKAKALRAAGWSYEAIGEELHVTGQTVINHLKRGGD